MNVPDDINCTHRAVLMAFRFLLLIVLTIMPLVNVCAQNANDGAVPLSQLPLPSQGMIVVTPDLKKALDALGAGSIVLSAERYQELMRQAEKNATEKPVPELLFAKCHMAGNVVVRNGREQVELTLTLDFQTEKPNAVVPVPLKGMRLSKSSLDGKPPPWGPDTEKWTLQLSEAGSHQLVLTSLIPLQRNGAERKFSISRLPASAITSLELSIPGTVLNPIITGYGSVTVQKGTQPETQLVSAPALGILNSLELIWQTTDERAGTSRELEGDIRITCDNTQADTEARLRPVPFAPIQLPWKIRIPAGATQVRAELLRGEGMNSEPLLVTLQQDGSYLLTSPYPLVPQGFTHLAVRWQQKLPTPDAKSITTLGSLEVLEPRDREQIGIVQINLPDDPVILLKPHDLQFLERSPLDGLRDPRRQRRYRYRKQPAFFDVVPLPLTQSRGVVEARLQHTLLAQKNSWQLSTDVVIQRVVRANVQQLLLHWPADWAVNRKVLFTPEVKDIEQDTRNETLRIVLDGRQSESFTIRLDSISSEASSVLTCKLPRLLSVISTRDNQTAPVELLIHSESLKVEPSGVELEIKESSSGLREYAAPQNGADRTLQYMIVQQPATLRIARQPKLPKYTSTASLFLGKDQLLIKQLIHFSAPPRQLTIMTPPAVNAPTITLLNLAGKHIHTLRTQRTDDADSTWHRYQLEWPVSSESVSLQVTCEAPMQSPLVVPLAQVDDTQAVLDKEMTVSVYPDGEFKFRLPADQTYWKEVTQEAGKQLKGSSLKQFLILERQPGASTPPQQLISETTIVYPSSPGYLIESELSVRQVEYQEWTATLPADDSQLVLLGWSWNNLAMPKHSMKCERVGQEHVINLQLPLESLGQSGSIKLAWEWAGTKPSSWFGRVPLLHWQRTLDQLATREVRWASEGQQWLWGSNLAADFKNAPAWLPVSSTSTAASELSFMTLTNPGTSTHAWLLQVPRSLSILFWSAVSLLLALRYRPESAWHVNLLIIALITWIMSLILAMPLALVILWGSIPGSVVGMTLRYGKVWSQHRRNPVVFQKTSVPHHSITTMTTGNDPLTNAITVVSAER